MELDASSLLLARLFAEKETTQEELALYTLLMQQSRLGHLCIDLEKEVQINHPLLHQSGGRLYFQKNWEIETRIVTELKRLTSGSPPPHQETPCNTSLTVEQAAAVMRALSSTISLITGGPGTGKSYTAAQIVDAVLKENPESRIFLSAPTGKAAANLERGLYKQGVAGRNIRCGTLHSFLGIDPSSSLLDERERHIEDLILIDEASMIDARLLSELLAAVRSDARLVLMGDAEQLPPVESGSLFADMVQSQVIPTTELTLSLRTDSKELLALATAIRKGDVEEACQRLSLHALQKPWQEEVEGLLVYPEQGAIDPADLFARFDAFRLLSCIRNGPYGVNTINQEIETLLLGKMQEGESLPLPILITKNDPASGLYNGDTGILIRHAKEGLTEKDYALFKDRPPLPVFALPSYELGYCLSVHKSQGSEYADVLLFVSEGSEVFGRELLYTAVTRAKKNFKIQAEEQVLRAALAFGSKKRSGLIERLCAPV